MIVWVGYLLLAISGGGRCVTGGGLGNWDVRLHGGPASNAALIVASVLGASAWLVTGATAWWLRRALLRLFVAFVITYAAALGILCAVSLALWGSGHCQT
jgi:hypothetical protein